MALELIIFFIIAIVLSMMFDNTKHETTIYNCFGIFLIFYACIVDKSALPDYFAYVSYFSNDYPFIEPSFLLIKWLVHTFFNSNVFYLFAIYIILGVSIKLFAFKKLTKLPILTLAIYVSSYFVYHEMIQIRAGIASALLLLSIKPLYDRNFKDFILITIVALLFHSSAIIFFICWFINPLKKQRNLYISLLILSIAIYCLNLDLIKLISYLPIPLIQDKIISYSDISIDSINRGVVTSADYNPFCQWYIIKLLITIYFWVIIDKILYVNKYAILLLKIYTIGISFLWLLASSPTIATRCSELLTIVQIVLIPLSVYYSRKKNIISYIPSIVISGAWIFWNYSSFLNYNL